MNEIGIATFAVDSYAGRGLVNYPGDPGKISFLVRIIDAFRALEVVAKHPMIDPSRIAVMGFSQGAAAALYSSMARFQKMYGNADLQFVGHISAYAGCSTRFRDEENVTKPILMLHGTADDLTPLAPCREYAERLSRAGKTASIIEYPDAFHQFDAPVYRTAVKIEQGATSRRCRLEEGENGVVLNSETKQPFSPNQFLHGKRIYRRLLSRGGREQIPRRRQTVFEGPVQVTVTAARHDNDGACLGTNLAIILCPHHPAFTVVKRSLGFAV